MRALSRMVVLLSLLAACENRSPLDSPVEPGGAASPAPPPPPSSSGGGPFASDAGSTPAVDAATALVTMPPEKQTIAAEAGVVADPPPPQPAATSCAELAAGGTSEVDGFVWQVQVTAGESSAALDFVSLGYDCWIKYQHANNVTALRMNVEDCTATHHWATNARFLEVLRTGDGCASDDGKNATESFDVSIPNREVLRRKTSHCPEPTLALERGCFRALVDRLFPR